MSAVFQDPAHRVTIDGVTFDDQTILEVHSSHGIRQPIATCDLVVETATLASIANLAPVVVEISMDGTTWHTDFTGVVRMPEPSSTAAGDVATVHCVGTNYKLAYEIGTDVIYAGGAKTGPTTIQSAPVHIGGATIGWYADTTPAGLTYDITYTPVVESHFFWFSLRLHGTNSYPDSIGSKKIRDWSRIVVLRESDERELGYANLPTNTERYTDELDYTDLANWSDVVNVFVGAHVQLSDGDILIRFESGTKPGSDERDDYEVRAVTLQTAGRQSVRKIVRGLKRKVGITRYDVAEIEDLDGDNVSLGGNGLVGNGVVTVGAREQPVAFISRTLDLFGYYDFDCPDGTPRTRPVRGVPSGAVAESFDQDTNAFDARWSRDPLGVYNKVKVTGASGNDTDGDRFVYEYVTDDGDVESNDFIPTPPGVHQLDISNGLLVSNDMCEQVGTIAEVNRTDPREIEWTTWPHALKPSDVVAVDFDAVSFTGNVFLTSIRTDIDGSGYRQSLTGWVGTAHPFGDDPDDPDPDEDDADNEPIDPRDGDEWFAYKPNASVQ